VRLPIDARSFVLVVAVLAVLVFFTGFAFFHAALVNLTAVAVSVVPASTPPVTARAGGVAIACKGAVCVLARARVATLLFGVVSPDFVEAAVFTDFTGFADFEIWV
jgi:hypothetical protein